MKTSMSQWSNFQPQSVSDWQSLLCEKHPNTCTGTFIIFPFKISFCLVNSECLYQGKRMGRAVYPFIDVLTQHDDALVSNQLITLIQFNNVSIGIHTTLTCGLKLRPLRDPTRRRSVRPSHVFSHQLKCEDPMQSLCFGFRLYVQHILAVSHIFPSTSRTLGSDVGRRKKKANSLA